MPHFSPLPDNAVWSCYNGKLQQGKLDVEALRTLTGEISCEAAVFTEDNFGSLLAEITLRSLIPKGIRFNSIAIHALGGANPAYDHVKFHNSDPTSSFPAIAFLDGDKKNANDVPQIYVEIAEFEDKAAYIVFGPGESHPETAIIDDISENLTTNKNLLGRLSMMLCFFEQQSRVKKAIETRKYTNRDPHLIFAQIGEDLNLLPEETVARAFITLWCDAFPEKVAEIWKPALNLLPFNSPKTESNMS